MTYPPIHCLTVDGLAVSHTEQVRSLCAAGARMIQVRMKQAEHDAVVRVVRGCRPICRNVGSLLIVNDHLEAALEAGADGVHLGKNDRPWEAARALAGPDFLIGGTVNSLADAERAASCGVLDYAGVGPYRFTRTKERLAEVLSEADWAAILERLGDLPSYAIGGIGLDDLRAVRALGLHGVAVCSSVLAEDPEVIQTNYKSLAAAWEGTESERISQS